MSSAEKNLFFFFVYREKSTGNFNLTNRIQIMRVLYLRMHDNTF